MIAFHYHKALYSSKNEKQNVKSAFYIPIFLGFQIFFLITLKMACFITWYGICLKNAKFSFSSKKDAKQAFFCFYFLRMVPLKEVCKRLFRFITAVAISHFFDKSLTMTAPNVPSICHHHQHWKRGCKFSPEAVFLFLTGLTRLKYRIDRSYKTDKTNRIDKADWADRADRADRAVHCSDLSI